MKRRCAEPAGERAAQKKKKRCRSKQLLWIFAPKWTDEKTWKQAEEKGKPNR